MPPNLRNLLKIASRLGHSVNPRRLVRWVRRIRTHARWQGAFSPSYRRRREENRIVSRIENLPLELLWIIFEDLNTNGLSRVSKTSKALRWAVEPILYAKISVGSMTDSFSYQKLPKKTRLLLRTLENCPQLGERVRRLSLCEFDYSASNQEGTCLYLSLLYEVPKLQRLKIYWVNNPSHIFRGLVDNGLPVLHTMSGDPISLEFPHTFEFLTDLTVGLIPDWIEKKQEELDNLVPLLYLRCLSVLTLDSLGMIWTHEDYQMPRVSSGIKILKLKNTSMSYYATRDERGPALSFSSTQWERWSKSQSALRPFIECIKGLEELTVVLDPKEMGNHWCDFAEALSDLQSHACTLKRLTIDMYSQWEAGYGSQRIELLKTVTQLVSLTVPYSVLVDQFHGEDWENFEFVPTDGIHGFLPPKLQELVITPAGSALQPAIYLAVLMEEKRRFEDSFHAFSKLWIGFRSKRYRNFETEYFEDEDYLEEIAPVPYGDDEEFSFKSKDLTVALRDVPGTSFRDFMGHFMKKYHDHMRRKREPVVDVWDWD